MAGDDARLVQASRAGQIDAFGHLVGRYQGLVCGITYSLTGDVALSEELAQEAFTVAWQSLERLEEPGRFRSWICGIARNLGRQARRIQRREEPKAEVDTIDPGPPLDEALDQRDAEAAVWAALEQIPERYREVLVLYYREGQSSSDVAEALGLTPATVDQRLSRGRKYLRAQVEDLVTRSLCRSKPSEKFSAAVLAGLPVAQAGGAAQPIASSTVAVAAKGGTMKTIAAVSLLGLAGLAASMNMCSVDDDESAKPQGRVASAKPAASPGASANDSHDARREQHWREQARAEARRENASRAAYVLTRISPESVGVNLEGGPSPLTGPASIGLEEPEPSPPVRTLTGRVIDEAGSGAADAIVLVGPPRMPGLGATLLASHGAQTDANGRFQIELRSDEALPVMALHRERGWSVSEQIPAGPADAEVELLLEPAPRLQGTVSQDGSPTPASITLESDRPPLTFFTDADGAFDIVAPAGAYRVRIRPGADLRDQMRLESPGLVRAFEAVPGRVDTWNVDLPIGALVALRVDQPWERGFAQVEYVLVIGRHEIETLEALDSLRAAPETRFLQHLVGGIDLDAPARFVDLHAGAYTVCALGMDHPDVLAFECRILDVNEDDNLEITLDPHADD